MRKKQRDILTGAGLTVAALLLFWLVSHGYL